MWAGESAKADAAMIPPIWDEYFLPNQYIAGMDNVPPNQGTILRISSVFPICEIHLTRIRNNGGPL